MRFESLDDLMEYAATSGKRRAGREEMRDGYVLIQPPEGDLREILVRATSGADIALSARLRIHELRAIHAVVVNEGWAVELGPDDPRIHLISQGRLRIRELEPPERFDVLNIIGESRDGRALYRSYRIDPPARRGGKRVFSAREESDEHAAGNFRPLFLAPSDLMRAVFGRTPLAQQHHWDQAHAEIEQHRSR